MLGEFGQEMARTKGEDPAVPGVTTLGEKAERGFQVGLFDEAVHMVASAKRFAATDIAIAGLGRGRLDAEGHQPIPARQLGGSLGGGFERLAIDNMVVAGADEHDVVLVER